MPEVYTLVFLESSMSNVDNASLGPNRSLTPPPPLAWYVIRRAGRTLARTRTGR